MSEIYGIKGWCNAFFRALTKIGGVFAAVIMFMLCLMSVGIVERKDKADMPECGIGCDVSFGDWFVLFWFIIGVVALTQHEYMDAIEQRGKKP